MLLKVMQRVLGQISYSDIVDGEVKLIKGKEPNNESTYQLFKVYYNVSYDIESGFTYIHNSLFSI